MSEKILFRGKLPYLALIAVGTITGIAISWPNKPNITVPLLVVLSSIPLYLVLLQAWAKWLLFASVAGISLSVYELPLPADQTLQVSRALLLIAIFTVYLASHRKKATWFRLPKTGIALVAFLLYCLIAYTLWSESNFESISILVAVLFGLIYTLWLPQVVKDWSQLALVVKALVFSNLLIFMFAVYQYLAWLTGYGMQGFSITVPFSGLFGDLATVTSVTPSRMGSLFRLTLPFSSSSHLGPCIAALMLVTLPLQGTTQLSSRVNRWLYIYHAVMFALLLLTFSRGAWLGWFVGVAVMVTLAANLHRLLRGILVVGLLILLIGVTTAIVRPELLAAIGTRFDRAETELSDETHLQFALLATEMFREKPLLGAGLGKYRQSTGIAHPHNTYLHILAELGIVGLTLLAAWIVLVFSYAIRSLRRYAASALGYKLTLGLLAAFVSIIINNFVQQSLYFGFTFIISGLICVVFYLGVDESVPNSSVELR